MRERDNYWMRRINSSRLSRRRFVGGAAGTGLGAAALGLVGCGDDDDDGGDSPTTASGGTTAPGSTTAATSPTAAAAPQGGVARGVFFGGTVYDSVDVHRAFGDPTSWLSNQVLNKVVRFKNPDTGEIEGDLAEKYEAPDASTYTFTVRKDAKWQKNSAANGRAITAQDLKWHFERQASGKLADGTETAYRFSAVYKGIKLETPDEYTLKMTLPSPNGPFLTRLAGYFSTVPNREATEKFEADHRTLTEEAMPASGAYMLKQWRAGKDIQLVKNPDNFRKGQPNLDGIIVPLGLFEDATAHRAAFEQKQVDSWGGPDAATTKAVIDKNKDAMSEVLTGVGNTVFLSLNMNKQFKDIRLVQAMQMAVDRRLMIQTFHQGLGQVSGPVTWLQEGFAVKPDDLIKLPGYRTDRALEIKEARALWEAGGGAALGDIDIKVPDTWLGPWPDTNQVVIKMFNDSLGVTQFKSTKTSYNEEIIPNLGNGNFPNWTAWTSQVNSPDPRNDLYSSFHSKGSTNWNKVNNADLDKYLDEAVQQTDVTKGIASTLKAQEILLKNGMFGQIVLYNYIGRSAYWNYYNPTLKKYPTAGTPGNGYNIFSGHLGPGINYINPKDPSFAGRPAATI